MADTVLIGESEVRLLYGVGISAIKLLLRWRCFCADCFIGDLSDERPFLPLFATATRESCGVSMLSIESSKGRVEEDVPIEARLFDC